MTIEGTVVGMELVSESGLSFVRFRTETSYPGFPKGTDVKAAAEFVMLKHDALDMTLTLGSTVAITVVKA